MEEQNLSLNQNLSGARIFLNLFDLVLEPVNDLCESSRIGVFDKNNNRVGEVFFEDGSVKIVCKTSIGTLQADYKFEQFNGFNDIECGGLYADWHHFINFNVIGKQNFKGNMIVDVSMDTGFGNHCRTHTKIDFIDKNGKKTHLAFMDEGKPFKYEVKEEGFSELLDIDPWSEFDSYLYHHIRLGKYDTKHLDFPSEYVRFVWKYKGNHKEKLRTVSFYSKDFEQKQYDIDFYDKVGEEYSSESIIQKGLLMQKIDPKFSKITNELVETFKNGDVSFFENLISIAFNGESDEVLKALFGRDIKRISFYNNVDNLNDAYFGIGEDNLFLPRDVYKKTLRQ